MKDKKSGKPKKFLHEIKINFDDDARNDSDVNRMCDEICRKETTYLNPAYISRQQVSIFEEFISTTISDILRYKYQGAIIIYSIPSESWTKLIIALDTNSKFPILGVTIIKEAPQKPFAEEGRIGSEPT